MILSGTELRPPNRERERRLYVWNTVLFQGLVDDGEKTFELSSEEENCPLATVTLISLVT